MYFVYLLIYRENQQFYYNLQKIVYMKYQTRINIMRKNVCL